MTSTNLSETNLATPRGAAKSKSRSTALTGFLRYALRRGSVILLTILAGAYLSVLVAT